MILACQIQALIHLSLSLSLRADSRGAAGPMSPSRESSLIGDDDEEEEDDEFRVFETLVTARSAKAESKFSQQDTLVIREDQLRVNADTCSYRAMYSTSVYLLLSSYVCTVGRASCKTIFQLHTS